MFLLGGGGSSPVDGSHQLSRSSIPAQLGHSPSALFNLVFPDDCRVCGEPLQNLSRIPVCPGCLHAPKPFLAEHFCVDCRTPFLNASPLDDNGRCALCRHGLTGSMPYYTYGEYEGPLRKLIHVFKYSGVTPLARKLGPLLSGALPREQKFDVIVPMPLHWRKTTGARIQSVGVAGKDSFQSEQVFLSRPGYGGAKSTVPQAGLTRAQRRTNVAGAFEVR